MYIDALLEREKDKILVVERINGQRVYREEPAEYVFYYEDISGSYTSIFGHTCKKFSTKQSKKFRAKLHELSSKKIFESDINPVFRFLAERYMGADVPTLNIGYFDIEAGFDEVKGYAPTDNPFNPVTAISLQTSQNGKLYTFALAPKTVDDVLISQIEQEFPNTKVYKEEAEMLSDFLDAIDDCDVVTGWNSEAYDIPYLVNRIERVLGKEATKKFCLWNKHPRAKEYFKFKKMFKTYEFVGRVHLDMLLLYQKHNPQQQHSYSLDSIGEIEVKQKKVAYDGFLNDLYEQDFRKFVEYSRQDVALLAKIDAKLKHIELSNVVAHSNCVLLKTTMGSVALVEQAIINAMHKFNRIVPDKKKELKKDVSEDDIDVEIEENEEDEEEIVKKKAVGAYVAKPKTGLHTEIACCDINSLYPSAIRALNMSPETIIGQVRQDITMEEIQRREKAGVKGPDLWEGIFQTLEVSAMHRKDQNTIVTVDFEDGTTIQMSAAELYEFIFNEDSKLCITSNGTIFSTETEGMIPALLALWYAERKELQGKQKEWAEKARLAKEANNSEEEKNARYWEGFYKQRQQAKKILLNSLYGALLNEALRFHDARLGQSTTLSGRTIVVHMNAAINQVLTGIYDYMGDAILYSDTDSVAGSSIIRTNNGEMTIEQLFNYCSKKWNNGSKEYAVDKDIKVIGYDPLTKKINLEHINYVYRHKVKKKKFKITDSTGKSVVVTEDHSIMVERNGKLTEIKPNDLQISDILVTLTK